MTLNTRNSTTENFFASSPYRKCNARGKIRSDLIENSSARMELLYGNWMYVIQLQLRRKNSLNIVDKPY